MALENGGGASAEVRLDDEPVFSPNQFDQNVQFLRERRVLDAGSHALSVDLRSRPDAFVVAEILHASESSVPHAPVAGSAGVLRLFDLFADPMSFTPDGDGTRDTSLLQFVVDFDGKKLKHDSALVLDAQFEIASAASCATVIRLERTLALPQASTARVEAIWDGTDASGNLVAFGRYFYRAVATVSHVRPDGSLVVVDSAASGVQTLFVMENNGPPALQPPTVAPTAPGAFSTSFGQLHTRVVTQQEAQAELAQGIAATEAGLEPTLWINLYKDAAKLGAPSMVLATLIADDGPVPGEDLRASRWTVTDHIAGPSVSSPMTIVQIADNGRISSDGFLLAHENETVLVLVERRPDEQFTLINDPVTGTFSFARQIGAEAWQFEGGAAVTKSQLETIAGTW